MSKRTHTPGPWVFHDGNESDHDAYIVGQWGNHVERICTLTGPSCEDIVRADACLIVSAPCMLSTLKAADASMTLGWTDPGHADARHELGSEMCEIWMQIRSVISQAEEG